MCTFTGKGAAMFKSIAMIRRKEGTSLDEFIRHYEEVHVPLALRYFEGCFKHYVRNYMMAVPGNDPPPFDVISEFWVEDENALARIAELNNAPEARTLREDEAAFMDVARTVICLVDERVSVL